MPFRIVTNVAQTALLGPDELALFHRRKLHRLLEIGEAMAEIALATAQRNAQDGDEDPTAEPAAALERIARGMRRTMMLDRLFDQPLPKRRAAPADIRLENRPQDWVDNRRDGIIDAAPGTQPHPDAERLDREYPERLDRPDFLIDLAKTTPAEVIADIEREFGTTDLANPQDLERLYARMARECKSTPRPPGPRPPPKGENPPPGGRKPPPPGRGGPPSRGDPRDYWDRPRGPPGPPS